MDDVHEGHAHDKRTAPDPIRSYMKSLLRQRISKRLHDADHEGHHEDHSEDEDRSRFHQRGMGSFLTSMH